MLLADMATYTYLGVKPRAVIRAYLDGKIGVLGPFVCETVLGRATFASIPSDTKQVWVSRAEELSSPSSDTVRLEDASKMTKEQVEDVTVRIMERIRDVSEEENLLVRNPHHGTEARSAVWSVSASALERTRARLRSMIKGKRKKRPDHEVLLERATRAQQHDDQVTLDLIRQMEMSTLEKYVEKAGDGERAEFYEKLLDTIRTREDGRHGQSVAEDALSVLSGEVTEIASDADGNEDEDEDGDRVG